MSYDPYVFQAFQEEMARPARVAEGIFPMHTGTCVYVDGIHVRDAVNKFGENICPHKSGDEMGERHESGWTVQTEARDKRYKQLLAEAENVTSTEEHRPENS
jgi:hypothetical protein